MYSNCTWYITQGTLHRVHYTWYITHGTLHRVHYTANGRLLVYQLAHVLTVMAALIGIKIANIQLAVNR